MGAPQTGLFCAIVQLLMKLSPALLLIVALAAAPALAQRTPTSAKTTEQQARSYVLSAFMTGAAPLIISDDVRVAPELREQLGLPPDADARTVYQDLMRLMGGKPLNVRPAIRDEIARAQARPEPDKPCFTIEAGGDLLLVQYDLERDDIIFVAQPGLAVAQTKPPSPPAPAAEPPMTEIKPAPAPAAASEPLRATEIKPAPAVVAPQIIEPQVPRPAAKPVPPAPAAQARPPALRPSGPCVIKPVMSDQDLVNCGATPR
jgi:hypothetical protein